MSYKPPRRPQFFYTTAPLPCPYLAGRTERKVVTEITGPDAERLHDRLSRAGFRRSHNIAYAPVCPSCQADYRKGDLFCKQCGTSLAPLVPARAVCTSCGTAVLLPARFCNACGHALEQAAASEDDGSVEGTRPRARPEPCRAGAPAPPARRREEIP